MGLHLAKRIASLYFSLTKHHQSFLFRLLLAVLNRIPFRLRLLWEKFKAYHWATLQNRNDLPSWESDDIKILSQLIQPGSTVLDIGAHYGFYAIPLSRIVGEKGQVRAFEPVPFSCEILIFILKKLHINNVQCHNVALSDKNETLNMVLEENKTILGYNTMCSHIDPDQTRDGRKRHVQVEARRFDDMALDKSSCRFIKCDVEGAELMVFRGMEQFLRTARPFIMVEIEENWTQRFGHPAGAVVAYLNRQRYDAFILAGGKFKPADDVSPEITNYYFFPQEEVAEIQHLVSRPT